MKDTIRQIGVVISILATITVNVLANALPINGLNTGQISDRFDVYFVPAGYVFSIWGLIYIGLIAFAIYQALPSQKRNPRLRSIAWWVILGSVSNAVWIFLWHYEKFPLTLIAMLVLLGALIVTYLKLGTGKTVVPTGEKLAVRLPFSVYLGWITVATVANVTSLLDYIKWNGFGIAPESWMLIILVAVLLIAVMMNFTRRDTGYALVILWALAGISVKHSAVQAVALPTWLTFSLVLVTFVVALAVTKKPTAA